MRLCYFSWMFYSSKRHLGRVWHKCTQLTGVDRRGWWPHICDKNQDCFSLSKIRHNFLNSFITPKNEPIFIHLSDHSINNAPWKQNNHCLKNYRKCNFNSPCSNAIHEWILKCMYLMKTAAGKAIIQCAKSISTLKHAQCSAAVNPETTNTYSLPKISF